MSSAALHYEPSDGSLDDAFAALTDSLAHAEPQTAVAACGRWRAMLDGVEATALARIRAGAANDAVAARATREALGERLSRAELRRRQRRADVVDANPALAERMRAGEISGDQVDALLPAFDATADAVRDPELLDSVLGVSPDLGRRRAKEWADDRMTESDVAHRIAHERENRRAYRFTNRDTGLPTISLCGDEITINRMWQRIEREADALWRNDGGRDLASGDHPRTYDQRLFDAMFNLFNGSPKSTGSGKPAVVITIPIDKLLGDSDVPAIEIGNGPLSDEMVLELAENGEIYALISDMVGQPLWLGRTRRQPTRAQLIAMIVRDKGCTTCGKHWSQCEAHHMLPWNSPAAGQTDINALSLNCPTDHHWIHDQRLTQYRTRDGTIKLRPARPEEIAPPRPKRQRGSSSREVVP